ncbi:pantoate--beta-alanine ligase [Pseudoxanthomonas sangjuensis]|uniref:pantoate--beta-alanine ligase n=1 Tax=Pseudoxanthomonas sangjuensis TaxID=1503750 RepID=UPI00139185DA|nr:pantoate--beta-alanine ligase [Pseudoxanthomonas sangjuensis]KAF1715082.1 pantoate--beta-alanine ligase [Pseudoxanthomonas sangjuensis]
MLETITDLSVLRERVRQWKREGHRVGFVPTMGNLHAGHYSLVMLARQYADRVVSSVFVNPTQFGPNEDFTRYPRTVETDKTGLEGAGCDVLWLPTVESMYPFGVELASNVHVPGVSSVLEGEFRPGHFDGVCTVVSRLFNQVQPDVAAFGKKDYQQLAVVRQLVTDLAFPIEIIGGSIVREADGLAMSSRNQYLGAEERPRAAEIHRTLLDLRDGWSAGRPRAEIEAAASGRLAKAGFAVDYATIRRPDLSEPADGEKGAKVALIAARLGRTRLIDNLEF